MDTLHAYFVYQRRRKPAQGYEMQPEWPYQPDKELHSQRPAALRRSRKPNFGGRRHKGRDPLKYGKMDITIAFVNVENVEDQQRFMNLPRSHFNVVRRREHRQLEKATETLLFDRSLEVFEQLKPSTLKPTYKPSPAIPIS
ncbi:MAG: hypothetical protein Q9181_006025 [Wetmoreana brouardii]